MTAEILTIGDEILIGQIINTNSVWIAQQLNLIGIKTLHMASVADDETAIIKAFDDALTHVDFVFITGGLGPTKDDITKKTFAKYFNSELVLNEDVLQQVSSFFLKRGKKVSETNRNQAYVPKECIVINNPNGTAPGMWMQKNNTVFISMPGVPHEMKAMITNIILPKIKRENSLPHIYHKTVLTSGIGESALSDLIEPWENNLAKHNIKLAYLPQPGIVRLRLSTVGPEIKILQDRVEAEIEKLKNSIAEYIYGYENYGEETPSLAMIVIELLRKQNKTLALAESCTGGYISSMITAVPGASTVFKGAIIPYSNAAKCKLLNVDEKLLNTVGAVSKECVEQLAQNVLKKFSSDFAISISGIAGPTGGSDEKPVGTVWIAVTSAQETLSFCLLFGDNRQNNIQMTAIYALNLLRKFVLKNNPQ